MAWVLGIDCSSTEMGLGLWMVEAAAPAAALSRFTANSHAEHIAGSVRFLLESNGAAPEEVVRVGVAVGPGSFTGLRIATAFVKGFVFGRGGATVLPLSSLESAALAWPVHEGRVVVAFDARAGDVFWARFEYDGDGVRRLTDDCIEKGSAVVAALAPDETVLTDTVGYGRSTVFAALAGRANVHALEGAPCLRGLACARAAAREPENSRRWKSPVEVLPVYLRATYAEEQSARAKGGGL